MNRPPHTHGELRRGPFTLSYEIVGQGAPIVVIGSARYYLRAFARAIHDDLRWIFVDHRGFAQAHAPYTLEDLTLEALVEDIEALRLELGLDQITIMGHSGHGYIALAYADRYPASVSAVTLIAMSPDASPSSFAAADLAFEESVCPERKALWRESISHLEQAYAQEPHRGFIHYSLCHGPKIWFDPTFDATALWEGVEIIPELFASLWGSRFALLDIKPYLSALRSPLLLLLGRYDYWNPPHLWEPLRGICQGMTIRIFEQSGHTPPYEEPANFKQVFADWHHIHHSP